MHSITYFSVVCVNGHSDGVYDFLYIHVQQFQNTLILCCLYPTKHETMTSLKLLYNIGLLCENTEINNNTFAMIEFAQFTLHTILNQRVFIIKECQLAPYMRHNYFLRLMFYTIPSLVERVPDTVLVFFLFHSVQLLCEQRINIATLQEQRIVYKAYIHIKPEHSRLQIGLSSSTMVSTSQIEA